MVCFGGVWLCLGEKGVYWGVFWVCLGCVRVCLGEVGVFGYVRMCLGVFGYVWMC